MKECAAQLTLMLVTRGVFALLGDDGGGWGGKLFVFVMCGRLTMTV